MFVNDVVIASAQFNCPERVARLLDSLDQPIFSLDQLLVVLMWHALEEDIYSVDVYIHSIAD